MWTKVFKRAKKVLWPPGANFKPIQTENGIIPWWVTWSVDTCWFFFLRMKNSWKRTTTSVISLICKRSGGQFVVEFLTEESKKKKRRAKKYRWKFRGEFIRASISLEKIKLPRDVNYKIIFLIANLCSWASTLLKWRQMLLGFALPAFMKKKKRKDTSLRLAVRQ